MTASTRQRLLSSGAMIAAMLTLMPAMAQASQTSSIALTPNEQTACAVNQDSDSISLWNFSGDDQIDEIKVGDEPRTLAVAPDGRRVYVTNQRSGTLSVVDLVQRKTVATIALDGQPYGVVLDGDGRRAFVSQYSGGYVGSDYSPGMIAVVDLVAGTVVKQIPVKARPWAMALTDDGRSLYVTHFLQIDGKGIVTEIDPSACVTRREIELAEDEDVARGGGVFNGLAGIALHPNGRRAVVVGMHANTHRGLTQSGQPLTHDTTVQAVARVLDLEAGREIEAARTVMSYADSDKAVAVPSAVAFVAPGDNFLALHFASHDLKRLAFGETGSMVARSLLELPEGPTGMVVTHDGRTALVNNRWDRSVSRVSLEDAREPRIEKTVSRTAEPWDEQRILGARVFNNTRDTRMTPGRWLSCGVCHLDGGMISDTITWEFTSTKDSPVFLNTKELYLSHGTSPPFLAGGGFHAVQEEEHFVRDFLKGTGFVEGELPEGDCLEGKSREMDAVAAYVLSLRPRPNPHLVDDRPRPGILASAKRGHDIFFNPRVGCSRCHKGPNLTRSGTEQPPKLYDVGTGIKADVPSLRQLWDTAPYLHDGRAKTLLEVRTLTDATNRHGHTDQLDEQELNHLLQFLLAPFE